MLTSPTPPRGFTRRDFIHRMARFGSAAVLGSLYGLDLLARDSGSARGFRLDGVAPVQRRRVIILGGGNAGLSAAYELNKVGYEVTVLEARARPGGRCWTVRPGTEETDTRGERQVCQFADRQYFNAGPMRISHHHTTTLNYCREFGIPLTAFNNFNEAAYLYRKGQPRRRLREVMADVRGYTAELLAKVVKRGQLDEPLSAEDRERLVEYLRGEGRLDDNLKYIRSGDTSDSSSHLDHFRGYTASPGDDGGPGKPIDALDLETLIKSGYCSPNLLDQDLNQQPTLLTPIGGMDHIPRGFASRLGNRVRYETEVREIRRTPEGGVRVVSAPRTQEGALKEDLADFCVCALPPHLLARLPNDFGPRIMIALSSSKPDTAGKIGLQFRRRFWEEDDDIYGGRSLSDEAISQVYYPSEDFGASGPGVLIGSYHFSDQREAFDRPHVERERLALEQGSRLHPQYTAEFESSFSVEWHRVRHNEMSWVNWKDNDVFNRETAKLVAGDPPFYFAGDWMSHLNGWQAGAFVTSHQAVRALHARALQKV